MADNETELVPSGDSCGACLALQGTSAKPPIHPNCMCQAVRRKKKKQKTGECTADFDSIHFNSSSHLVGAEVEITCSDGTSFGQSVEVPFEGDVRGLDRAAAFDAAVEALTTTVTELCSECPEDPDPPDDSPGDDDDEGGTPA